MLTLPIPLTSTRLDFTLPFGFLPVSLQVVVSLTMLAGLFILLAWLYRLELRRVGLRAAWCLLGLRLAAVATVFLALSGSPVVVRPVREAVPGRVVVAVDLSNSVRVADPDRPLGEKLRLVRGLRLNDGVVSDDRLNDWIADVARSGLPHFPPPDTEAGAADRAAFEALVRRVDPLTRLQAVERALASDGAALLDRLKPVHAVELVGFDLHLHTLPTDPDALRSELDRRSSTATTTDLHVPLADVQGGRSGPVVGVVLVTDGRHNAGDSPVVAARALGEQGTPVFPVNVAPRDPQPDVAVVAAAPAVPQVCRGSSVPVAVRVQATRWPAGRVVVELSVPNGPPLTQAVQHDGPDRTYEVTFHPRFERAGTHVLKATARPGQPDPRPDNNTREVRVRAVDSKPRVLLIDGEARWEFRFLRSALVRSKDPELDVKAVVFRQPRIGQTSDAHAEKAGLPALKLPEGEDSLSGFDCVVLGDVEAEQWPLKERERLEKAIADGGGTLVVVAGKRSVPIGLWGSATEADPFRRMLPVRNPRAFAPDDGLVPEFTADGRQAWFLRLGDTPEGDHAVWESFPPHGWAAIGEAKDGAEVLARARDARAPLSEARGPIGRDSALIARHHYGFGQVLYVGLDSTWRWRFKAGERHHHRFWKQVMQWAVAGRLLPAQNAAGSIRFGTREPAIASGREVEFVLRTTEAVPRVEPGAASVVRVIRLPDGEGGAESVASIVPLQAGEGRPREFGARLRDLAPGRYAAEPEVPEWGDQLRGPPGPDGRPGRLRATFEVLPPAGEEMAELSANVSLLEGIARESGGRVFDLASVNELVDRLVSHPVEKEIEVSTPLRRSWWTFALVSLLLTVEWLIRKRFGLA